MGDIYVGTSGWSYPDWKGVVYPQAEKRSATWNSFRAISTPSRSTRASTARRNPAYCLKWLRDVKGNPRFKFTAKLWQRFTHERTQKWKPGEAKLSRMESRPCIRAESSGPCSCNSPGRFPMSRGRAPGSRASPRSSTSFPGGGGCARLVAEESRRWTSSADLSPELLQH